MFGNNITAAKIMRVRVPLFTIDEDPLQTGSGNKKYFFPENPTLDNATIVGIEAHYTSFGPNLGDISINENGSKNIRFDTAQKCLVTIYSKDKTQSFANIPLISLFPNNAGTYKRVNPYFGEINTRMSYCILVLPSGSKLGSKQFVNLTFYYNPKK
jgi:hypothetical protein